MVPRLERSVQPGDDQHPDGPPLGRSGRRWTTRARMVAPWTSRVKRITPKVSARTRSRAEVIGQAQGGGQGAPPPPPRPTQTPAASHAATDALRRRRANL